MIKNSQLKKKAKQEAQKKKAKKQRKVIIGIIVVVFLALSVLFTINALRPGEPEVFSDGEQTVTLLPNGTFTAELVHDGFVSGTYNKSAEGGITLIEFRVDGDVIYSIIELGSLYIP